MFRGLFHRDKKEAHREDVAPEELVQAEPVQELSEDEPPAVEAPSIEEAPVPPDAVEEPEPEAIAVEEEPVQVEAVAKPEAKGRKFGFFKRVASVFTGRKIDESVLEDLEEQLIMSDVSIDTAQHLIDKLREAARRGQVPDDDAALGVLKQEIASLLGEEGAPLRFADNDLTVWLFVGVNGVGKTTTIGKVAKRLVQEGRKPLLVAGDTFRAAAMEQLQEWGRRADVPVIAQQSGADPAAVVFDGLTAAKSRDRDIVLVDTAGRLHTKSNLMNELAKISRVIEREAGAAPTETLLVLDASTGQNGLVQAQAFTVSAPLTGLVLTKWDGTAKGGIILTVARETGVPVKLIGVGEKPEDLIDFDPKQFADEMFGE